MKLVHRITDIVHRRQLRRLADATGLTVQQLRDVADAEQFVRFDVLTVTDPAEYARRDANATAALALVASRTPAQREALRTVTMLA